MDSETKRQITFIEQHIRNERNANAVLSGLAVLLVVAFLWWG